MTPDLQPPTLSLELGTREGIGDDAADDNLAFRKGRRCRGGRGTTAEEREERRKVVAREGLRIRRDACAGMAAASLQHQEFSA